MVTVNVSVNVDAAIRLLDITRLKQLPFATSLAINRTANKVKDRERHEISDVFDRPTPFTLNSLFVKPSNKYNLTAIVGLKDSAVKGNPASKYLAAQITGGERRLKGYEVLLRSAGILPNGMFTVPGAAALMDGYGNMQRGQLSQILSYFKSARIVDSNSTDKTRSKLKRATNSRRGIAYFVGRPANGKLPLGIWMRVYSNFGTALRPVLMFVDSSRYDSIFDFKDVAERTVSKEFGNEFYSAWNEAERTAR